MIDKDTGTLKRAGDGDACNFTVIMDKITIKSKTTSEQPPFYIAFVNDLKKKMKKDNLWSWSSLFTTGIRRYYSAGRRRSVH